jgi:hypothetical protein
MRIAKLLQRKDTALAVTQRQIRRAVVNGLITMEVVERFISENIDAVGSIGVGMDTCE